VFALPSPGVAAIGHVRYEHTPAAEPSWPLIIGHRGACGHRPEHTLASYDVAISLGADVIEPDLVSSRDGVLVARHENDLSRTTDVSEHPAFADRRATKTINGQVRTGWFTEDFTLAELRRLRARERSPHLRPRNTRYDGRYRIPTFQEIIRLAQRRSRRLGREIAVCPEIKHATYFRSIGLALEERLVAALRRHGWGERTAPVLVQSFDVGSLRRVREMIDVRLLQLVDVTGRPYDLETAGDPRGYRDLRTREGLRDVAGYADGIGPHKDLVIPGAGPGPTPLVPEAHDAGLAVYPWTFREEHDVTEYLDFFAAGVDGVFSDYPDRAAHARRRLLDGARRVS
jgi:glycerophosphoryl diester phosphodiesterase